jgi:hypothetical protein
MLRISLRRSRADWPIVLAAGLICLLAATLLAAGSIYASAVSTAGLHRVLTDAPTNEANVEVSARVAPGEAVAADEAVTTALDDALRPPGSSVTRVARSDSFALPDQPAGEVRNLAVLGWAEGLADHASLIAGAWPGDPTGPASAIPVAVSDAVAAALGLQVGDRLPLQSRLEAGFLAPAAVSGIFSIDNPADGYWWGDPQATEGIVTSERYVTYGPFYATERSLLERAAPVTLAFRWHASLEVAALSVDEIDALASRIRGLDATLAGSEMGGVTVSTRLPDILADAGRSLLVSRTGVLLLTIQLVVLAAYAVLLSASLLIEHRRIDTAMLRSRGAGPWRIVGLAAIEAVLLTVPAGLVAPWLGVVALRAFNVTGPLADIGLAIDPLVSLDAYLAAGAATLVCFLALTLPSLRGAGSLSSVHGRLARGETASVGQRLGLDVALLVVAGVGLWQLRLYGAPLTRTVKGTLGLDPLLVATPAIGLLAGGVVALRVVPLLAQVIEFATARRRGLVPSLGARQLARRPLRYTRAALLLMLAMAMGVFSVCYTWTWTASQRDQAGFQVGADVRVVPGTRQGSMPRWALDRAYSGVAGVNELLPVARNEVRLPRTAGGGLILAMDADVAPAVATLRADLAPAALADLTAPLSEARPLVAAAPLPGGTRVVRMDVELDIRAVQHLELDAATGVLVFVDSDLEAMRGAGTITPSVVVRDGRGLLYRFTGAAGQFDQGVHHLAVDLGGQAGVQTPGVAFVEPLELLAIETSIALPERYQVSDATITVGGMSATDASERSEALPLELGSGWRSTVAFLGRPHGEIAAGLRGSELAADVGGPGFRVLPGADQLGRGTTLTFAPAALDQLGQEPVPVVANDAFLATTASAVGDNVTLTVDGVRRTVRVSGSIRAFPTTDPAESTILMDLATLSLLRFEGSDATQLAEEWWLAVDDGARPDVMAALQARPFTSLAVASTVDRNRALATDPVALGIIGALAIGFAAAAMFAVVGFMVSAAVSARERIAEFALLRALGLSPGQLSVWLSLENAALAAVSLAAGSALGLVIAWVVLPFVSVTQNATTPFPPVEVAVPWSTIALLEAIALGALGLTVAVLTILLRRVGLASVLRMSED